MAHPAVLPEWRLYRAGETAAPGTVALQAEAEGQWLLPEMASAKARWSPDLQLAPARLRECWTEAARCAGKARLRRPGQVLVVEKSPPNMCRLDIILAALHGMPITVAVLTRDPYAVCASWHRRYGRAAMSQSMLQAARTGDQGYFAGLGALWLHRARMLAAARDRAVAWIAYEDLAREPERALAPLQEALPVLRGVQTDARLVVKDHAPQPLRDMNAEQIAALSPGQLAAITRGLAQDIALVESFGYRLRG
jgi:hypothetical protein